MTYKDEATSLQIEILHANKHPFHQTTCIDRIRYKMLYLPVEFSQNLNSTIGRIFCEKFFYLLRISQNKKVSINFYNYEKSLLIRYSVYFAVDVKSENPFPFPTSNSNSEIRGQLTIPNDSFRINMNRICTVAPLYSSCHYSFSLAYSCMLNKLLSYQKLLPLP